MTLREAAELVLRIVERRRFLVGLPFGVASLVAGAIVTESIFAWPGMGRLFINALGQFDFSLLMGYLMMVSVLVVLFNLLADVAYAWLDPRVKYD